MRRARAAYQLGKATIPAQQALLEGKFGPIFNVPVEKLLSPKPILESNNMGFSRWRKMLRAVDTGYYWDGDPLVPIEVIPDGNGTPIGEVMVEGQDDIGNFS